jgi:hypothetical protein
MAVVAVLMTYEAYGESRKVVVWYTYLPYDSVDPLPFKSIVKVINVCKEKLMGLVPRCDANCRHVM